MIYKTIKGKYIYFHTFFAKNHINYNYEIELIRKEFLHSKVQIINANSFFNFDHIIEVLKISLSAEERFTMVAKKIEVDFLMRIIGTNNIQNALKKGGIKNNQYNTLIAINKDLCDSNKIKKKITLLFGPSHNDILLDKKEKEKKIESFKKELGLEFINEESILKFLIEKAVLIYR